MMNIPEYVCTLYFEGQVPCFGGVLALNGKTGDTLWIHWTAHAIFSVDCGLDLTSDKINDCIICGRGGIFHAINGRDGTSIWEIPIRDLSISEEWKLSDIYDAKFISDIDGDEIGDIIASHTTQSREIHSSEILLISGINGNIIRSSILPRTEQLFLAPQNLVHPDGESIFVLVTTSHKQSGGLYIVPQVNLMYGNLKLRKLHHDVGKGTLLPPILVDITLDGIQDIVAAMFNSTIIVYDGLTFEPIWNYTVPNSEVISIPVPGYYNDDNVPDFMVKHQIGLGFPTYYYTVATIIDGKTGKSLLEKPIEDSLSREMSGLSVTVDGFGNDWFLHWSVDCLNYEGIKEKYQFLKNMDPVSESRVDLCKLRFNSTLITNLYALSQHVGPPGVSLYFSEDWKFLEYNNSMNSDMEPGANAPYISERSPKIYTNQNEESAFEQEHKNRFNVMSDDAYDETYKKYTDTKSLDSTNKKNNNLKDAYVLGNQNKIMQQNVRISKDYDGNNKLNVQVEQPTGYQQVDKIRKRRNNVNHRFLSNVREDTEHSVKKELNNETGITNKTNTFLDNGSFDKNKEEEIIVKEDPLRWQVKEENVNVISKAELKEQRKKRDVKNKDGQVYPVHGVQKQPPTGILLPSILKSKETTSIDLVFSTFWLPSSDVPIVLIEDDLDCIHWKKVLSEKNLQYKENDDIIKECLNERGINYETHQETADEESLRIPFGQMTIYRMRLECTCPEDMLPNQSCKNISLHQSWSEYLGSQGNGYFKPLYKTNL